MTTTTPADGKASVLYERGRPVAKGSREIIGWLGERGLVGDDYDAVLRPDGGPWYRARPRGRRRQGIRDEWLAARLAIRENGALNMRRVPLGDASLVF